MIKNITGLAKEVGSRATAFTSQMVDIQRAIKDHTDGDVWARFTNQQILFHSNISPAIASTTYPFTNEDFWKAVEYVQEEGLEWVEEGEEEEISLSFAEKVARTQPHEYYD